MRFALAAIIAAFSLPALAESGPWPNKPGKKPAPRLVVGAQAGLSPGPAPDVVIGAGGLSDPPKAGDYGFVAHQPTAPAPPAKSVGYDPTARLGNKAPSS